MITKMASKVADFFIYRNWIEKDEHEIYRYGMEVILSFVINFCIVLICGIVFREMLYTFLFYVVFLLMRKFCGGYHADTYLKCNIVFALNLILINLLIKILNEDINYILFLMIIFSILTIAKFAPIVNLNKPVGLEKQRKYRIIAIILLIFFALLAIYIFSIQRKISISIIMSLFSVAFAMLIEKIKSKEVKRHEDTQVG